MPSQKNIDTLAELTEQVKRAQSLILVDYRGLNAAQTDDLRTTVRQTAGVELRVRKNRLIKLALRDAGCEALDAALKGTTAVVFSYDDPIAAAKLAVDYSKKNDKFQVKGGILERKALSKAEATQLADAPSREQLLARLMGSMNAPATNVVRVIEAARSKVVRAVDAVRRKREEEGGETAA